MTDYVATRWYRAPEIITGWVEYTKAVDMWAVGCILAELLGRKPLWPGSDSQHQLELICQCVGKPGPETIDRIQTPEIRDFVLSIPNNRPVAFHDLYPDANPRACDLLRELLIFEPERRCDVEAALAHPYLAQLHFPDDEPRGPEIPLDAFQFEMRDLDADELKREILREIWFYHWDARNSSASRSSDDDVMFAVRPRRVAFVSLFLLRRCSFRRSRRRTRRGPRPSRTSRRPRASNSRLVAVTSKPRAARGCTFRKSVHLFPRNVKERVDRVRLNSDTARALASSAPPGEAAPISRPPRPL